jgi:hypothetical protein
MSRKGAFLDFVENFNAGLDTVNKVGKDYEISKLANSKDTAVYNPDQVDQRAAISGAVDAEGKPLYTVSTDANGQTQVQSNLPADDGTQPVPFNIAANGTQYLGKTYDHAPTDSERGSAKSLAMSNILTKYGDPEGALRFQTAATQMARQDKQDAQGDQRFAWDKTRAEREQRQGDQTEADQKIMRDVDKKSADWFKARLANPDGTQRPATIDDHLAAFQNRASELISAGRVEAAGKAEAEHNAMALAKIHVETAQRDVDIGKAAAAINAGDLNAARDFYNAYVPDGAKVTNVTRDAKGQIVIERETMDGRPMSSTVMKNADQLVKGLETFKNPDAMYQWTQSEFRNNLALNADKRAASADGRAATEFTSNAPEREAKQEEAKLRTQLAKTEDPAEQAKLTAKIQALRSGTRGLGNVDPAHVKEAAALVASGAYPDTATALEAVIAKPDKLHQDYVKAALTQTMGDADKATETADKLMRSAGWSRKDNVWTRSGRGGAATAPAGAPTKGAVVNGFEFQGGNPNDKANWKAVTK